MGVFKRSGEWWIDFYVNGRRKREKVGPSWKLAQTALRKRKIQIAENKYLDLKKEEKVKFTDFAETYMNLHSKPNKKSWKTSDANSLKNLIPFFGSKYLHEIDPMMIERYKIERRKHQVSGTSINRERTRKQISGASVNRELTCLKCMFNRAIDWGIASANPVRKVKFFKEEEGRLRYLEKEEIRILLGHCSSSLKPIITLAIHTGMRKGEIQNLKWGDIDIQKGFLTLRHTKNGAGRSIPLNPVVKEILLKVRKHPDSPYVFCGEDGFPYNFRKAFETALERSGIKNFRFHDLRHTFASQLVMSGVDLNTVRELLGHKDLKMTLRYAHLSPDHKQRAVELLASRMDTIWTPEKKSSNKQISLEPLTLINSMG